MKHTTMCSLILAMCGAAAQAGGKQAPPAEAASSVESQIITDAYAQLSSHAASAVGEVAFKLANFTTIERKDFHKARMVDVVTMPGGEMINTTRKTQRNDGVLSYAQYDMEWKPGERWLDSAEGKKWATVRLDDMIQTASAGQPELADTRSLTTYDVTVTLAGKSRAYKAAFIWFPLSGTGSTSFLAVDHITQGVAEAASETAATFEEFSRLPAPQPEYTPNLVCTSWSNTQYANRHAENNAGHISGGVHYSDPSFAAKCTCTSTCESRCDAWGYSLDCAESGGLTEMCHKMASAYDADTQIQGNGNTTGATCSVGFGCVMKPCPFCICGLSVGVSAAGGSVTFTSSGSPTWSGNLKLTRTCARCY